MSQRITPLLKKANPGSYAWADMLFSAARTGSMRDADLERMLILHEFAAKGDKETRKRVDRYRRTRAA